MMNWAPRDLLAWPICRRCRAPASRAAAHFIGLPDTVWPVFMRATRPISSAAERWSLGWPRATSLARMSAIIVRADLGPVPAYAVLGDSSLAEYLWGVLVDAMAEFDGQTVGVAALEQLIGV